MDDSRVMHVYCHWDGYPTGVGATLKQSYKERSKVLELIRHGDISTLQPAINPVGRHNFHRPEQGVTVFFGRDRLPNTDIHVPKISLITDYPPILQGSADYAYMYDLSDNWLIRNSFKFHANYVAGKKNLPFNPKAPWVPLKYLKLSVDDK